MTGELMLAWVISLERRRQQVGWVPEAYYWSRNWFERECPS
jgi:hypothetical protein